VSSAFGEGSDQVYLASSGGTSSGDYSAFAGEGYWISMSSPLPEDQANAKTILEDILQALPSG